MKTLKTLAVFCLGVLLIGGCASTNDGGGSDTKTEKGLILSIDKSYIYDNGGLDENGNEDKYGIATFSLRFNGKEVTDGYTIYEEVRDGELIYDVPLEGKTYTSTTKGNHYFWAEYGVEQTKNTTLLMVVSTPPAAPAAPVDNNPTALNFKRRVLLTQFTGSGCGFCPGMVNALYTVLNNEYYQDKFVLAAAHLYNETDKAYLYDAPSLANLLGVRGYPTVNGDYYKNNSYADSEHVIDLIDECLARTTVKGGIAVSSELHEDSRYVVINTLVKASEKAEFRIGAWLLEDKIEDQQANNGYSPIEGVEFNVHNNCVRLANSRQNYKDFTGLTLGTLNAGDTATQSFAFSLLDSWKTENMHVVVFISTKEGDKWYVNNVVNIKNLNGVTEFEYEE